MNRWDELITGQRAGTLRALLCKAADIAHTENGARFDPDDLGDDALIYGLCTTHNARHVAARLVEDAGLDGVAVCERGRVWWLEIERADGTTVRVYFYKAPPGAHDVHGLRLDDAEIKKELSSSNGKQLALFNRSGQEGSLNLLNVVVVHYGDPTEGLDRLDVGAPYVIDGDIAWDWHERFDLVDASGEKADATVGVTLGDDGAGYTGLRLVSDESVDSDAPEAPAAAVDVEQATSEFEELGLLDDVEDDGAEAETDQERQ